MHWGAHLFLSRPSEAISLMFTSSPFVHLFVPYRPYGALFGNPFATATTQAEAAPIEGADAAMFYLHGIRSLISTNADTANIAVLTTGQRARGVLPQCKFHAAVDVWVRKRSAERGLKDVLSPSSEKCWGPFSWGRSRCANETIQPVLRKPEIIRAAPTLLFGSELSYQALTFVRSPTFGRSARAWAVLYNPFATSALVPIFLTAFVNTSR